MEQYSCGLVLVQMAAGLWWMNGLCWHGMAERTVKNATPCWNQLEKNVRSVNKKAKKQNRKKKAKKGAGKRGEKCVNDAKSRWNGRSIGAWRHRRAHANPLKAAESRRNLRRPNKVVQSGRRVLTNWQDVAVMSSSCWFHSWCSGAFA